MHACIFPLDVIDACMHSGFMSNAVRPSALPSDGSDHPVTCARRCCAADASGRYPHVTKARARRLETAHQAAEQSKPATVPTREQTEARREQTRRAFEGL